jgi:sialate O-acetylesterase
MRSLVLFLAITLSFFGQTISIVKGPADYQVYQRGANGKADIPLELKVEGGEGKTVFLSIKRGVVPVPGFIAHDLGKVANGALIATVKDVPAGGPYRFEFRTSRLGAAQHARSNVLVGDIWLLAGQSNMEGVGDLIDTEKPSDKVNSFNQADVWVEAKDPLHELVSASDRVHWRKNASGEAVKLEGPALDEYRANRKKGAGLGLPFAIEYEKRTGVPVGLLPCAHGGTSMSQWNPDLKAQGGDSLYGATIRRAELIGGKVKGILWYQGESDANPTAAPLFQKKFEDMVAAFRKDLNDPNLPFFYVQIGRHVNASAPGPWNSVQESQRLAEKTIPNSVVFSAVDSDLDDGIHVSTQDLKRLGRGMAAVAAGKAKKGPHLDSVTVDGQKIRLRYTEVNGKLTSLGRITGFSIANAEGQTLPLIYKTTLDPLDGAAVILHLAGKLPEKATLSYGAGRDPIANLRDELGLGAPVFGPWPLNGN